MKLPERKYDHYELDGYMLTLYYEGEEIDSIEIDDEVIRMIFGNHLVNVAHEDD